MHLEAIKRKLRILLSASLFGSLLVVLPGVTPSASAWTGPSPSVSTFGGTGGNNAIASTVDPSGNVYITGSFSGTVDFDPGPGTTNLTSYGGTDSYVAKFDPSGALLWAKHLGGTGGDAPTGIALDGSGNVVTVGNFTGTGFFNPADTSTETLTSLATSLTNGYVSKLSSTGSDVWAKRVGNVNGGGFSGVAVDTATGSIYLVGQYVGTLDLDPGPGTFNITDVYNIDAFSEKLNSDGTFGWGINYGSGNNDSGQQVVVTPNGNATFAIYVGASATINVNPYGSVRNISPTSAKVFYVQYNSSGILQWVKMISNYVYGMATDSSGDIYSVGTTSGVNPYNPDTGGDTVTAANGNTFILKQSPTGAFMWVRQIPGYPTSIFVDANSVYVAGYFSGSGDFNPGADTATLTSAGSNDAYVLKLDTSGNYNWAKKMGGTSNDQSTGVVSGQNSQVYISGFYSSTANLGPSPCVINFTAPGGTDTFLMGLDSSGNQFPLPSPTFTSLSVASGYTPGGTVSTLTGTGLICTTGITVDGNAATKSIVNDTSVTITTPAGTEGTKDVVVTTLGGAITAPAAFTYVGRYRITYNGNTSNGGTQQPYDTFTVGTPVTLPATTTFTKTGFTFGGWATSSGSTTAVTSYSTHADTTFYAIWNANSYTVTFDSNSVTATGAMAALTKNTATALTLNAFTYTNRTFIGWNTVRAGTGTAYTDGQSYPFVASATLYAQWGYGVTYSSAGADSGSPSRTFEIDTGTVTVPTVGTMVKAGYTFGGWTNGVSNYTTSYTPVANITLNPIWTPKTYTVSFNKNGATSGSVPGNQTWAESTTALTLSGNTGSLGLPGYTFGGWAVSASAPQTAITTFSTTSNTLTQTLYAIWTPISYTVTYALNGGDLPLPTQSSLNTTQTFTVADAPTKSGYIFSGWSDSHSIYSAGSTYTVATSNVTLTAQWNPVYTLHYILNGSLDTPAPDTTTVGGTVLVIADTPTLSGYTFTGWLDSNGGNRAPRSNFSIIQNSNMTAQWSAIAYTVTYNTAGATSDTPTQTSLNINQHLTIATTPTRTGYLFTGWSDGTNTYGAGADYVVGTSNIVFTAQWSAVSYTVTYDLGNGYLATPPTQANVNIGNTFSLYNSTDPTWLAHTFLNWSDGTRTYAKGATYTTGAANIVLTAQYSQNGYTRITYAAGTGGAGNVPTQNSILEGLTFTVANASTISKSGYTFLKWNDGTYDYNPGDTYYVGPASSPITLTAQWIAGYGVTYTAGAGSGSAPTDSRTYSTSDTFVILDGSSLSYSGYTFNGWSDGTNLYAVGDIYTVASTTITFTAQWQANPSSSGTGREANPSSSGTGRVREVEELTHSTSLSSKIVQIEVSFNEDKKTALSYFNAVQNPTKSATSAPSASQIQSVSTGLSINTQSAHTNSLQPATISLPSSNIVLSDLVVQQLAKQATIVATSDGIKVTPVAGFTGNLVVPTVATINGEQIIVLNNVVVNPVAPVGIGFAPVSVNKSAISWAPSVSQVVSYEIQINGKTACQTVSTSCPIPALIGPNSKVTITALGNDLTTSDPEVIPYNATAPIPALKVNFATASSKITEAQKAEIRSISRVIKNQGFTRLIVNGFTDARGGAELNAVLAQARAKSVAQYMQKFIPEIKVKVGALGSKNALGSNSTSQGQALNRRTEIATW